MKHPLRFWTNVLLLLALLPALAEAQKQKKDNFGKEFYVAFAENHGSSDETKNFFALFITSKVPTRGTVQVPGLSNWSMNFVTTPGTITTIELPDGKNPGDASVECRTSEQILQGMGVHITSDDDIAVFGMNHKEFSSDAFMALPVGVLGTEYRTLNYQTSRPSGNAGGQTPGEFWIVGVADSTNITITPKARTANGSGAGIPIRVLLNKSDVFLVKGDETTITNDLTGSLIVSDQPIAVLSGHVRTEIPNGFKNKNSGGSTSRDHLCEQLPPVSAWGDSALVVRYQSASLPDLVRIVSSEDGNIVSVTGFPPVTLNAGEFYEVKQLTNPISIQATSPILVGQYMHTSVYGTTGPDAAYGDPAYSLVFPVEQFDTSYTFMLDQNPTFNGNFVNIVADPDGVATMMLDGKPITGKPYSAVFQPIPGSRYVYAQISFDIAQQGAHNIFSTKTFGITVYALGDVDSYSYPGGTLLKTITPFKTVDLVIDFGDRVMTGPIGGPYPALNNHWDTTVYLQNISSDPYAINRFVTQGGNAPNNFSVPKFPSLIGAGVLDSMQIEFTPDQPNIRMHTKITAQTDHLRAYVVDVYGRGVLPNIEIYSDSLASTHVDTLDFGILDAAADPPKDSFVFLFNKGAADLLVTSDAIAGPNANDFSILLSRPAAVAPPYTLRPSNVLGAQNRGAIVPLQFNPTLLPNGSYQAEYDVNTQGQQHKVILLARVKTILKSAVQNVVFDTAFLCQDQSRTIFIDNPNDFPITVTGVNLGGANFADFNLGTQIPLVIPPKSRGEIQLKFAPNDTTGLRNATATLTFDLPKGYTQTLNFSAYGDQLTSSFWARSNIHILPGEETLFPVFAKTPMEKFSSPSLELDISYDSTHLQDIDFIQVNTLTANGAWDVFNDSAGYSRYIYHTLDGSVVSGGSETTSVPLVYIKFKSHLNDGDNPVQFHRDIDIHYKVSFNHSPVPEGCILSVAPVGRITLDSSCETVYLLQDTLLYPVESYIEPIRPNPVLNGRAKFVFDVPQEDIVHLDVIDMFGNKTATILNESRKPGTYELQWDASKVHDGMYYVRLQTPGQVKLRKMVISR